MLLRTRTAAMVAHAGVWHVETHLNRALDGDTVDDYRTRLKRFTLRIHAHRVHYIADVIREILA